MKSIKFAILLVLIILTGNSQGDIIVTKTIPTSHQITNLKDFPDVTFFAVYNSANFISFSRTPKIEKLVEDRSIGPGGYLASSSAEIYAVKNKYLTGKKNEDIDWHDKRNVMKSNIVIPYYFDNIGQSELKDIRLIENKYTIAGFNDSMLVLYKSEVIYKFKDFQKINLDSVIYNEFDGDAATLDKTFN